MHKETAITDRIDGIIKSLHSLTRNHPNLPLKFHKKLRAGPKRIDGEVDFFLPNEESK